MSLVDKSARHLVIPGYLEWWKGRPTNLAVQESEHIPYNPTTQYNPESGDYTFEVPANSEDYLILEEIFKTFALEIRRVAENAALVADESVGFENIPADIICDMIEVKLGDEIVESIPHYPYKAYMETLLTKESSALETEGRLYVFEKDTAGHMNKFFKSETQIRTDAETEAVTWYGTHPHTVVADDADRTALNADLRRASALKHGFKHAKGQLNHGLQKRAALTARSRLLWVCMRPRCDTLRSGKLIPNGVPLSIRFRRSSAEFVLHSNQEGANAVRYKVLIHHPRLWVPKAKIFPTIFMGQNRNILKKPARFNIRRTTIKPVTIPNQTLSYTIDNVTVGQLPRRVLVGLVSNAAFDGDIRENPFNFQHANLSKIALYVNGKCHPSTPYTPRYEGADQIDYTREYNGLLTTLGYDNAPTSINITYDDYPNGYCIYGFDLSPDKRAAKSGPLYLTKTGNTRLEMQFRIQTPGVYVALIFAEYDNIMKIDGDRHVYVNYTI